LSAVRISSSRVDHFSGGWISESPIEAERHIPLFAQLIPAPASADLCQVENVQMLVCRVAHPDLFLIGVSRSMTRSVPLDHSVFEACTSTRRRSCLWSVADLEAEQLVDVT